jgi:curved DNA-binding protein CbpA
MATTDYYEILGLRPSADGAMVDQAYWHLARKYQALAESDARAQAMLDKLNEAYAVLGTPRRREEYDRNRRQELLASGHLRESRAERRAREQAERRGRRRAPSGSAEGMATGEPAESQLLATILAFVRRPTQWHVAVAGALIAIAALVAAPVAGAPAAWVALVAATGVGIVAVPCALAVYRTYGRHKTSESANVSVASSRQADRPATMGRPAAHTSDIQESTAAMIERWRQRAAAQAAPTLAATKAPEPDTTLVDIFRSEEAIEREEEPLRAVLEVLRGTTKSPVG